MHSESTAVHRDSTAALSDSRAVHSDSSAVLSDSSAVHSGKALELVCSLKPVLALHRFFTLGAFKPLQFCLHVLPLLGTCCHSWARARCGQDVPGKARRRGGQDCTALVSVGAPSLCGCPLVWPLCVCLWHTGGASGWKSWKWLTSSMGAGKHDRSAVPGILPCAPLFAMPGVQSLCTVMVYRRGVHS